MNIGELTERITLQQVSSTDETIVDLVTLWAKVKPLSGQRQLYYEQLHVGQWFEITFAYLLPVTYVAGDPITYEGRQLTVHSIQEVEDTYYKVMAYSTGIDSATAPTSPLDLVLTWDDIANVPVPNPASAYDWNWYFGTVNLFRAAEVSGNVVNLIGGGDITLKASLFAGNTRLVQFVDTLSAVVNCASLCFSGCVNCTVYRLPGVTAMGTTIWSGISGKTIAITVKTALTANANVTALEAANTVTKTLI